MACMKLHKAFHIYLLGEFFKDNKDDIIQMLTKNFTMDDIMDAIECDKLKIFGIVQMTTYTNETIISKYSYRLQYEDNDASSIEMEIFSRKTLN